VGAGYFSTPASTDATLRIAREQAQPGSFALNGVENICPEGSFCAGTGLTGISGYCPAGSYCPPGAATSTGACIPTAANGVASAKYYCPGGDINPSVVTVLEGYYSTPENVPITARTGQAPCSESEICLDGQRVQGVDWEPNSICGVYGDQLVYVDEYNRIDAAGNTGFVISGAADSFLITGRNNFDENGGQASLSYSIESFSGLTPNCPPSLPLDLNTDNADGVFLETTAPLDFETCEGYSVVVKVQENSLVYSAMCTLTVQFVNKNDIPYFNANFEEMISVDEHSEFGLALGPTLFASDYDLANTELSYSIVNDGSYPDAALNHFRISDCSGLLYVNVDVDGIDYLTKSSYTLKIRACDDGQVFNPSEPNRCTDELDPEVGVITIAVVDVNDPPNPLPAAFSISEGATGSSSAQDLVVGKVDVTDADISGSSSVTDIHRYSISDPTNTFSIVDCERANNIDDCIVFDGTTMAAGTILLSPSSVVDFEIWTAFAIQYVVTVVVQDRVHSTGTLSGSESYTISIVNANDPPTAPATYDFYLPENSVAGDIVLLLPGSDDAAIIGGQDEDEAYEPTSELLYSISGGNSVDGMNNIFELTYTTCGNPSQNCVGLQVSSGADSAVFDYEAIASIVVEVTITDNGVPTGLDSADAVVLTTIHLLPENEAPVIPEQSFSIMENDVTFLGALSASDPDNALSGGNLGEMPIQDALFFSVSNADSTFFSIARDENANAFLTLNQPLDFESGTCCCGGSFPVCTVEVTVADRIVATSGLTDSALITYTVLDVDEAPSITSGQVLQVDENRQGTTEGALAINDPDIADIGRLLVTIDANSESGYNIFEIITVQTSPHYFLGVKANAIINYESFLNTYQLTVNVVDADDAGLSASAVVTVSIQDVNDIPVINAQEFSFSQLIPPLSEYSFPLTIGTLQASDEDASQSLTFSVASQSIGDGTIDVTPTGELQVTSATPSAQTNGVIYDVVINVSDGQATGTASITIRTTEQNQVPTCTTQTVDNFANCVFTFTTPENVPSITIAENLDIFFDDDDELAFTITQVTPSVLAGVQAFANVQADDDWFQIIASGSNPTVYSLEMVANGAQLDYERIFGTQLGRVEITIEARDDDNAVGKMTVSFQVTDINEVPTINAQTVAIDESPSAGGVIATLIATDEDEPDSGNLEWTLTNIDGTLSTIFEINPTSGELSMNVGPIDFETDIILYQLTATVTDTGWEGDSALSAANTITVEVHDVNEPPVLLVTAPSHCSISEDTAVEVDVPTILEQCTFTANDPENEELVYTVETYDSYFSVAADGKVTLLQALDYEEMTSFTFNINVQDSQFTVVEAVTFTVLNVNDVPTPQVDPATQHATTGGETITLTSPTNVFGPLLQRVNVEGPADLVVTYGSEGQPFYTATGCTINWVGTENSITCDTVPGVGSDLFWRVIIDGDESSRSLESTNYGFPSINAVGGVHTAIPTDGGVIVFSGANFGPRDCFKCGNCAGCSSDSFELRVLFGQITLGDDVELASGYSSSDCLVTEAHSEVTCTIPSGVGDRLRWQVQLGNKKTPIFPPITEDSYSSFIAPNIISIAGGNNLATQGGESVTLTGTNFGSMADFSKLFIYYGPVGETKYLPVCSMTVAHSEIVCSSTPGSGGNHEWSIVASGLSSAPSTDLTNYKAPVMISLSGPGALEAKTQGGQQVYITGENFGPFVDGTSGGPSAISVAYGDDGVMQFTAVSCEVTTPHEAITCLTGEGYGLNHQWTVEINNQVSVPYAANSSYGVPIVFSYEGNGASASVTQGGSEVVIEGRNFGSAADNQIDMIVYVSPDGTVFDATSNCGITIDHAEITCLTVAGAGTNLRWRVTIAGQDSEFPTTTYAEPVIYGFRSSVATMNGNSAGGEDIVIVGNNFGPVNFDAGDGNGAVAATFLNAVTYGGGSGTKYTAVDCAVTVDHTEITCKTSPGVGQNLAWVVEVGNQFSLPSTSTCSEADDGFGTPLLCSTSYAVPRIDALNPAIGLTSGVTEVTVLGANFGVGANPAPELNIFFDGQILPVTSSFDRGAGVQGVTFIVPECTCVSEFAGTCGTLVNGNPAHLCEENRTVVVAVDALTCAAGGSDACTDEVDFDYGGPTINTVTIEDLPNQVGSFRLRVIGENFCSSIQCGEILIGEISYTAASWSHSEISVIVPARGDDVRVKVGSRISERVPYVNVSPILSATTIAAFAENTFRTEGTETAVVEGLYFGNIENFAVTIGICPVPDPDPVVHPDCSLAVIVPNTYTALANETWTVTIEIPEGSGAGLPLKVWRGVDSTDGATVVNYGLPVISSIRAANILDPLRMDTIGGTEIIVTGDNFGTDRTAVLTGGTGPLEESGTVTCTGTHTQLTCTTPPGEGVNFDLRVIVEDQQSSVSADSKIHFKPPEIYLVNFKGEIPTQGGGRIVLFGDNFGIQGFGPSIFVDVGICNLCDDTIRRECDISHFNHTFIECALPAGQGANLNLFASVSNQVSTQQASRMLLDVNFPGYNPPVLVEMFEVIENVPNNSGDVISSATRGGTLVQLNGANFGEFNAVALNGATEYPWTLELRGGIVNGAETSTVFVQPSDIESWDHSQILFRIPEGQGPNKSIILTVADQISSGVDLKIDYFPPVVTGIQGPAAAIPLPLGRTTAGGYEVSILGDSLGVANAKVTMGGLCANSGEDICMTPEILYACRNDGSESNGCIVSQTHNEIRIIIPPGAGAEVNVEIDVDGAISTTQFSYDPPRATGLSSKIVDANGGNELEIYGYNFGNARGLAPPVNLLIDNTTVDCDYSFGSSDDGNEGILEAPFIRCNSLPRLTVGLKDMQLTVAYQESDVVFQNFVEYKCLDGYYGAVGEFCVFCGDEVETGYVCEDAYPPFDTGHYENIDNPLFQVESDLSREQQIEVGGILINFDGANPFSAPGWWRDEVTPNSGGQCLDGLIPLNRFCPVMRPCEPQSSCLGNNTCAPKYDPESPRCSICNAGFFRLNGECTECPQQLWLIIVVIVLAIVAGLYIAKKLKEKNVNWTVISIGVDYFQVLAIFATTNVKWPDGIQDLYDSLSFFNLNLELLAPECWGAVAVDYKGKWFSIEAIPLVLILLSLFPFLGALFFKRYFQGRRKDLFNHLPSLISNVIIIMYFMYLFITNVALAPFNCQATTPDDGKLYMAAVGTDAECGVSGGTQQTLVPYAVVALIVYTIGFPLFVAFVIFRNKENILIDQVHRAERTLPHILKDENMEIWHFRKSFYILYYQYKPEYYWWIMVILARKACISIAALIFRKNTIFQLCMILLVMFVSYSMQVRFRPFMSQDSYEEVVQKNKKLTRRESLRGRKANFTQQVKLGGAGDAVSAKTFSSQQSKNFFFNYNTVEAVLLFCAVLVNLSGIMFESGQLENGNQNDALAYLVICLISFSLLYFCIVLGAELLFAFFPDCWLFRKKIEEEEDHGTEFTSDNPLVQNGNAGASAPDPLDGLAEDEGNHTHEDLQEMQDIIQQQKDEIKQLQQQLASDNLTKGLAYAGAGKKEKKKKKNFGGKSQPTGDVEMSAVGTSHQVI
jgi:hypothetical protein